MKQPRRYMLVWKHGVSSSMGVEFVSGLAKAEKRAIEICKNWHNAELYEAVLLGKWSLKPQRQGERARKKRGK